MSPIEILYSAINSPLGVVVETEDPERLKQRLAVARKSDPALAGLAILTSPTNPTAEVWVMKKNAKG